MRPTTSKCQLRLRTRWMASSSVESGSSSFSSSFATAVALLTFQPFLRKRRLGITESLSLTALAIPSWPRHPRLTKQSQCQCTSEPRLNSMPLSQLLPTVASPSLSTSLPPGALLASVLDPSMRVTSLPTPSSP